MTRHRVAVVGGGLAGIAAALAAADGGAAVTVVERRSHLGGLTWSFRRNGRSFDNGQHVFLRCCTEYRGFLDRIGAAGQTHLQPRLDIPVLSPGGGRADITRTNLPSPLHLAGALLRYRHLSLADRARLGRPTLALRRLRLDDPALDDETFGSWLARHGQRPAAIEKLWDLITLPTVNVPASDASLALAAKVFRTGLLDHADGADVGWSTVPLGELHGANAARALAAAGVDVRVGTTVDRLAVGSRAGGRDSAVTLTVRPAGAAEPAGAGGLAGAAEPAGAARPAGAAAASRVATAAGPTGARRAAEVIEADAVIVATPPDVAAALLPAGALPAVTGLGTSPIVNVHLVFDRHVTDLPLAAAVDSPVQFVFDHTAAAGMDPDGPEQCLVVSLSAADAFIGGRPDDLVRTFHDALGDLFPAARRAGLVDGVVSREHTATFRGRPGTAALRPSSTTSLPGLAGVLVAGAWCDTGWPATMEGAVRSGTDAARAALRNSTNSSEPCELQETTA
ncbi:MAG TPA: FAD-dependent oxidoreductase [Acidimicrobiales bacterium]|nr:FAD-dependent oxidoreductase [Acidimicrobiales bacterium]